MAQYSVPRLDKNEARITSDVVEGLRSLVASHGDTDPPHTEVARVCLEAGMDKGAFYYLDNYPGLWGYDGGWFAALRRLRNNAPRDVLHSAFVTSP